MEREVTSKRQEYVRVTLVFICFFPAHMKDKRLCVHRNSWQPLRDVLS